MTSGIILMGGDERRQIVRLRPVRASLHRRATEGYEDEPSRRLRDVVGVYLGLGRWHLWLYFRERHLDGYAPAKESWFTFVDIQRQHEIAEASR